MSALFACPEPFLLRALNAGIVLAIVAAPLGCNIVWRRMASDGETLAAAMRAAGDKVEQKTFPGVTHEFFGMDAVVAKAREAQDFAVQQIKKAFGQ